MEPRESDPALLTAFFRDHRIGCPSCHYDLRNLAGTACPECGTRLQLRLSTRDLRLGNWMVGVLAVALPLGFTATLAVLGGIAAGRRSLWWRDDDWTLLGVLAGLTLVYVLMLAAVFRRRESFLRRSPGEQRVRAWGLVVVMLGFQIGLFWLFNRFDQFF